MKILIFGYGHKNTAAVSDVLLNLSNTIVKNEKIEIVLFGYGDKDEKYKLNDLITIVSCKDVFTKKFSFYRVVRKINHICKFDRPCLSWKRLFSIAEEKFAKEEIDYVIGASGYFMYMHAAYHFAKKHKIEFGMINFDSFSSNKTAKNIKLRKKLEQKWYDFATFLLENKDDNTSLIEDKKNKKTKFQIPLFKKSFQFSPKGPVVYGGNFYGDFRNSDELISFLNKSMCQNESFLIYSNRKNDFANLKNVISNDLIDNQSYEEICKKAKALIVIGNKESQAVPSKITNAISFKKPIIGINTSSYNEFLVKYPFYYEAEDPNLFEKIQNLSLLNFNKFDLYKNFPELDPNMLSNFIIKKVKNSFDLSKIKVSIITPTYNDEKYIVETIDSVLNQTHKNFELIIIDDNSLDSTVKIIERFNDKRIKLIKNNVNKGAAYARNLGLKNSTGDYIAFLDGDDVWLPNKLESQLRFMISKKINFSCTDYEEIDENSNPINVKISAPDIITHKKLMHVSYIGCLTVMYKKSIYPDLQIPEGIKKRNDYALWLKLSEREDCYCFHKILSKYRRRKKSISSGSKVKLLSYHKDMFKQLYKTSNLKASLFALRNAFYYFFKRLKYSKHIRRSHNFSRKVNFAFILWLNVLIAFIAFVFGSNLSFSKINAKAMTLYNYSKNESVINLKVEPTNNYYFDYSDSDSFVRKYYENKKIKAYIKCDLPTEISCDGKTYDISLLTSPVFGDYIHTEFLHLPLYKPGLSIKNGPKYGADFACYIPSSIADKMLIDYGKNSYDELISMEKPLKLQAGASIYSVSINNVYLNNDTIHWSEQNIEDEYYKTFSHFLGNGVLAYAPKLFVNSQNISINFDLVPNFSVFKTIIKKGIELSGGFMRCTITKADGSLESFDFFSEMYNETFEDPYQIALLVCFVVILLLEIFILIFDSNLRKTLFKVLVASLILFVIFSFVGEVLKTVNGQSYEIYRLFNAFGNMIIYLYLLNLTIVAVIFEAKKEDGKS